MRSSARVLNKVVRGFAILAISVLSLSAQTPQPSAMTEDVKAALARISADSLRGHLSFIASDALEGRNTPSRGLDIAAEYIAAQFRRAGLEPVGDAGSYFQTSEWSVGPVNNNYVDLAVDDGKQKIRARADQLAALGVRPG